MVTVETSTLIYSTLEDMNIQIKQDFSEALSPTLLSNISLDLPFSKLGVSAWKFFVWAPYQATILNKTFCSFILILFIKVNIICLIEPLVVQLCALHGKNVAVDNGVIIRQY